MNKKSEYPQRPSESESPSNVHEVLEKVIRHMHPEWVEADGTCPRCESYEYDLAEEVEGRGKPE